MYTMKKVKTGLWGLILLLTTNIWGQGKQVIHEKITWNEPVSYMAGNKEITFFDFDHMGDIDPETNLSKYTRSVSLPDGIDYSSVQVEITNKQYIWPTPKEHLAFKNIILNSELSLEVNISQSGHQYFADISFIPAKRDPNTSTFQKLSAYDMEISYDTLQQTTLKSTSSYAQTFAENSVLSDGSWSKIQISESGIYKISYTTLKNWGISNPENVGIYGNGGGLLPQANDEERDDDLVENAVWHYNSSVYFYAEGPVTWEYNTSSDMFIHEKHPYSDYSYYFITEKDEESKSIEDSGLVSDTYTEETDYFNDYDYSEENSLNLLESGNKWLGDRFDYYGDREIDYSFTFDNIVLGSDIKTYIALTSRSSSTSTFIAEHNDTEFGSVNIASVSTDDDTGYYAREGVIDDTFEADSDDVSITLSYDEDNTSSIGYLDYISINVNRELIFIEDELQFRNNDLTESGSIVKYNLSSCPSDMVLWDVSNPLIPLNIDISVSNSTCTFNYDASTLKYFVAFDPSGSFPSPEFVENIENQNLHGMDNANYLIVCHPDFEEQAERLGEIHEAYNGLSYVVATTDQIYNEFSSGKPDVTAIRSFAKMFYDRAGDDDDLKPKNMLLFGDGSYDNRPDIDDNTNYVITYQSDNSIHQTNSYVSDDYFGFLDDSEGESMTSDKLDIGIGRFPVASVDEATNAVDKTDYYLNDQTSDSWKSQLTFVGDDGDSNIHMQHADNLAEKVDSNYPQFNIEKIYFDAYEKETSTVDESYPDVEDAIYDAIDNGTLIFNYTGHGGTTALAHEYVVTTSHIETWNNINKLPIFITATCEFSRFDENDDPTAGENIFLSEIGGGIALYSTTRIVYSSLNYIINNALYNYIFEQDEDGEPLTFGEIMKYTKHDSGSSVNKLNFTLLGDPALQPLYPRYDANTLTLNGTSITESIDTLTALSHNTLTGNILDVSEDIQTDYNGEIYVYVYDKKTAVTTLDNEGDGAFEYETYENLIFKGTSTVTDGEFSSEFTVPKDIKYNYDTGKISYYAYSDDDDREAFGAFDDFIVGGMEDSYDDDTEGPEISLYLNDRTFTSGSETTSAPLLYADISDENGINTTGSGIGHDITCTIDGDSSDPVVLNDYFQAEANSYQNGTIEYQLDELESGEHTLTVKAWDTYNNSSEASISFIVSTDSPMSVNNSMVYPNPVESGETTYFYFEHDEPNTTLSLTISIYTLNGQLIDNESTSVVSLYNTISPIEWDITYDAGLYLYKIEITSETGRKGEVTGKILVTQ